MDGEIQLKDSGGAIADAKWADPDYICDRYPFEPGKIWIGRNPHCFEDAVGYADSRHVLVCASSGAGKGRSFIINNLALWPGSVVTYDPKGELPQILAARRGQGDHLCEGMGQDVFVLDPLGKTGAGAEHLAYYDPVSNLDPEDGELPTWAKRIARSVISIQEGTESGEWAKRGARLIALIIMHVVTADYDESEKNLITVLRLIMEGAVDQLERIRQARPDIPKNELPDPTEILLSEMCENDACRGWIASDARNLLRQAEKTPKFFESVRGEAADQLDWLKSEGIEASITGHIGGKRVMDQSRQLDPRRLKTDPRGISVFIVMPQDDLDTYRPWVQTMFIGIFAAMRSVQAAPASGHQALCVLDEFLSLGYHDYIAKAMDNIRGAGMKLVIIVQNFGGLKKLYSEQIDSFYSNCSLELYFGKVGEVAGDYLLKQLGEKEVVRTARNTSASQSRQTQSSTSTAKGTTKSEGGSASVAESISIGETEGWSTSFSDTRGSSDSRSWSDSENLSHSKNWGAMRGNSMGKNYGPHIFWEGLSHSNNYGTNFNHSRGGGVTKGGSKTRGGSSSTSSSRTVGGGQSGSASRTSGQTKTEGKSWQNSESHTETQTQGTSEAYQIGGGEAETFHKKPLLSIQEMNAFFRDFHFEDRDHPAYPGLALVRITGEDAFFVRRSNYDQDPYFERCFSADPIHGYLPLHDQPTLGYQFTDDHLLPLGLPGMLSEAGYKGRPLARRFAWIERGGQIAEFDAPSRPHLSAEAPILARVVDVINPENQQAGDGIVMLRTEKPLSADERQAYYAAIFGLVLEDLRAEQQEQRRLEDQRRRHREEQERRRAEEKRIEKWRAHARNRSKLADYKKEFSKAQNYENALNVFFWATCIGWGPMGVTMLFIYKSSVPTVLLCVGICMFFYTLKFCDTKGGDAQNARIESEKKYRDFRKKTEKEYENLALNAGKPPDDVTLIPLP